jgi:hypothetical protein
VSAFVVLSVTIAIAIVAVTVVVGIRLGRTVGQMAGGVKASVDRIGPLAQELQDEAAVTQTELDHLQRRVSNMRGGRNP